MDLVNDSQKGGKDYPVVTGAVGIFTGMVPSGAGIIFGLMSMGVVCGRS